jgi:hypothetical protein
MMRRRGWLGYGLSEWLLTTKLQFRVLSEEPGESVPFNLVFLYFVEHTETLEAPREELTTGSTFAGRYQIIEEIGKGGMGTITSPVFMFL